jgi:hypothetical protein
MRNTFNFSLLGMVFRKSVLLSLFQEQLRWVKFLQLLKFKLINWLKEQSNCFKLVNPSKFKSPAKFLPFMFKKVTAFLLSVG